MAHDNNTQRPRTLSRLAAAMREPATRPVLLPALAALAGALLAGMALFRAAPAPVRVVPPGYVALVNRRGILMSDFMTQAANESAKTFAQTTPAERRKVLREMINEELMVQRGLRLDIPETTTEVRDVMVATVTRQVAEPLLAQPLSDAQLRAYYDEHAAEYEDSGSMTLRDLVLHFGGYQNIDQSESQARSDAADAAYRLRAGAPVDYVLQHFGFEDSGRVYGGELLEFAAKARLGPTLYSVARGMNDGEVSDPVADSDGMHLLVMEHRLPPRRASFDAMRDRIYQDVRKQQSATANEQNLQLLRRDAEVLLTPGYSE